MLKKYLLIVMLMLVLCQKHGVEAKAGARAITDGAGRKVILPAKIERLISIDRGFIPQVLKVLGKEKLLVATGGVYPRSGPFNRMKSDTFFLVPHVLDIPDVGAKMFCRKNLNHSKTIDYDSFIVLEFHFLFSMYTQLIHRRLIRLL